MAHKRKLIRDAAVAMLTGTVSYNAVPLKIYQSRVVPYFNIELPAISVYLLAENSTHEETAPREYKRFAELVVQIIVAETVTAITDDIIDEIAAQVEAIFFVDANFRDTADDSELKSTNITIKEEGDRIFAAASLVWEIEYRTYAPEAQALDDLLTENTRITTNGETEAAVKDDQTIDSKTTLTP